MNLNENNIQSELSCKTWSLLKKNLDDKIYLNAYDVIYNVVEYEIGFAICGKIETEIVNIEYLEA